MSFAFDFFVFHGAVQSLLRVKWGANVLPWTAIHSLNSLDPSKKSWKGSIALVAHLFLYFKCVCSFRLTIDPIFCSGSAPEQPAPKWDDLDIKQTLGHEFCSFVVAWFTDHLVSSGIRCCFRRDWYVREGEVSGGK